MDLRVEEQAVISPREGLSTSVEPCVVRRLLRLAMFVLRVGSVSGMGIFYPLDVDTHSDD